MSDDRYLEKPSLWQIIGWALMFIGFITLILYGFKYLILGVIWLKSFT